jgi:tetratricopeptide (TPR) repeat protein
LLLPYFWILFLTLAGASCGKGTALKQEPSSDLPAFDDLWNFEDPAGTEQKFRELLPRARESGAPGYAEELLTQIARTQGLQQKYAEALATLDGVDGAIQPRMTTARVRSILERGRVLNSSGKPAESIPVFTEALRLARQSGLEYYAVDAAHMLGIAAKNEESLKWNAEAIRLAEAAMDPKARRWLGALYNNTGWTYFDMGKYSEALDLFERHLEFRKGTGDKIQIGIARWSIAKILRHLGRVEESLKQQLELLEDPDRKGKDSEGYTHEEIGECLLLLGRSDEATSHFARAWELLHEDPWLKQDEPARLARLKQLGKIR